MLLNIFQAFCWFNGQVEPLCCFMRSNKVWYLNKLFCLNSPLVLSSVLENFDDFVLLGIIIFNWWKCCVKIFRLRSHSYCWTKPVVLMIEIFKSCVVNVSQYRSFGENIMTSILEVKMLFYALFFASHWAYLWWISHLIII